MVEVPAAPARPHRHLFTPGVARDAADEKVEVGPGHCRLFNPSVARGGLGEKKMKRAAALLALVVVALAVLTTAPRQAEAAPAAPAAPVAPAATTQTFEQIAANPELTDDHARLFRLYWAFARPRRRPLLDRPA